LAALNQLSTESGERRGLRAEADRRIRHMPSAFAATGCAHLQMDRAFAGSCRTQPQEVSELSLRMRQRTTRGGALLTLLGRSETATLALHYAGNSRLFGAEPSHRPTVRNITKFVTNKVRNSEFVS